MRYFLALIAVGMRVVLVMVLSMVGGLAVAVGWLVGRWTGGGSERVCWLMAWVLRVGGRMRRMTCWKKRSGLDFDGLHGVRVGYLW